MIVNLTENGWEVIYHRAHALLAAQLAGHWPINDTTARRVETVAAISHHDDLEREWEGDHLTPAGAPLDFTLSSFTSIPILAKHIEDAEYRGRWVALLTSMHTCFINEPKRQELAEMARFLDDQYQRQSEWRQALNLTKEHTEKAYAFMGWCDRLSLILCQRQLPACQRALEITRGPDGQRYEVSQRRDGTVQVTPWPFARQEFTVHIEATELSQMAFKDNAALVSALKQAAIKTLTWTFVAPSD